MSPRDAVTATVPTAAHTPITHRSHASRTSVRVDVLGPLEVAVGGCRVDVPRGLPARVLLALVANRHRMVSDGYLLDALWPYGPGGSVGALRNAVMRVRQALGDGSWAVERVGAGYRLAGGVDIDVELLAATAAPGQALGLVRGEPFCDVEEFGWARRAIDDAIELVTLVEDRAAARLVATADPAAVAQLQRFAATRPDLEYRWVNLMTLLRMVGRRADALRAARRARSELSEFGLSPGPDLRRLEYAVLADDDVSVQLVT